MTNFTTPLARLFQSLRLRPVLWILASMFVATGFAGLLAEQSFEKLLSALLGASTPAAAVVLAVYFLGLTLGALAYSRWSSGFHDPLRIYAMLELGVAIWSILLLLSSDLLVMAFVPLLRLGVGHPWLLQGLRGLVACIWILPPTMAMGATFPAIVDSLRRLRVPQPRRAMSRFYTLNLGGAILGALAGPYFVFQAWGLTGALGFTFLVDAMVAITAFGLASARKSHSKALPTTNPVEAAPPSSQPFPLALFSVAFASGFIFFGLEVVWTHLIGAVLGNSIYAFAAMLALVLVGLGIGGSLSTLIFRDRKPASVQVVALLLAVGSLALAWQHGQWPGVPSAFILWGSNLTTFSQGEWLRWIQAARLLLPPALIFGMVYPALFRLDLFSTDHPGTLAARMGAANSVGCVLGALVTGFLLIPAMGSEGTLMIFGILSLLGSLVLALTYGKGKSQWAIAGVAMVVTLLWGNLESWNRLSLTSGGHVYFQQGHVTKQSRLLFFHEDTLGGITTVVDAPTGRNPDAPRHRTLLTNGKFQANDAGEVAAQTGFAMVPFVHARGFEDALVIGLGSGHSAEVIHRMGFTRMDIAEIAPGIIMGAKDYFSHINGHVLDRPNVNLILEDGRNHLLLTDHRYDLITMEISSVWFAGSTSLYSQEFYRLAQKRLKPGGVFQQWIQVHHIGVDELGSVLRTLREVFPHVEFWVAGGQGVLLASNTPLALQAPALARVWALDPWGVGNREATGVQLVNLLAGRLLTSTDVTHLMARETFPLNTDSNRYLEYATPKYNLSREPHERINIRKMGRFATFPGFHMEGGSAEPISSLLSTLDPDRLRKRFELDEPRHSEVAQ